MNILVFINIKLFWFLLVYIKLKLVGFRGEVVDYCKVGRGLVVSGEISVFKG